MIAHYRPCSPERCAFVRFFGFFFDDAGMTKQDHHTRLLAPAEVALALGITPKTVRVLLDAGTIPAFRSGAGARSHWRVPLPLLERWVSDRMGWPVRVDPVTLTLSFPDMPQK
jgi:excisionase family DNA binding protein